jgi:hypothetical protein
VNERLVETNWLREQKAKPFQHSLQGISDVRTATALIQELTVKFDVLKGRLKEAEVDEALNNAKRQEEVSAKEHQVRLERLEKLLQEVKNGTDKQPATVDDTTKKKLDDIAKQLTELQATVDKLTNSPNNAGANAGSDALKGQHDHLGDPSTAVISQASTTSKEKLEDEAAHRANISAREREAMLDDTHDLNGYALYELKFDVSFTPGQNTRRHIVAELKTHDDFSSPSTWVTREHVERLRHSIEADVNDFLFRLQERNARGRLSDEWRRRTFLDLPRNEKTRNELVTICGDLKFPLTPDAYKNKTLQNCFLAFYLRQRLASTLQDYFRFDMEPVRQELDVEGTTGYRIRVDELPEKQTLEKLIAEISRIQEQQKPWIATVDPKEYAQNISDVSSNNEVKQLALALDLLTPKGVGLESKTQFLKDEQRLLQTIKRQPLATSFIRGSDTFGWVLGPKFKIEDGQPVFEHTPSRYTFTASIVVPSWFTGISLSGTGYWLDKRGNRMDDIRWLRSDQKLEILGEREDQQQAKHIRVTLPGSGHRGLFQALLRSQQATIYREPEIFMNTQLRDGAFLAAGTDSCLRNTADRTCEQTIVIEGRQLWRNPSVVVGNQKAEKVELLPDMNALVATFRALKLPAVSKDKPGKALDLTVITSFGSDTIPQVVTIVAPEANLKALQPFMRSKNRFLDGDADKVELSYTFDPAAVPPSYHSINARLKAPGKNWTDLPVAPKMDKGSATFLATTQAAALENTAMAIEQDVLIKLYPSAEAISILDPSHKDIAYFPTKAGRSVKQAGDGKMDFTKFATIGTAQLKELQDDLTLSLPGDEKLFFFAYPSLQKSAPGTAELLLLAGNRTIRVPLELQQVKGKTQLRPVPLEAAKLARTLVPRDEKTETYQLSVEYKADAGTAQPIPIEGSKSVEIKGLMKPKAKSSVKDEKVK